MIKYEKPHSSIMVKVFYSIFHKGGDKEKKFYVAIWPDVKKDHL